MKKTEKNGAKKNTPEKKGDNKAKAETAVELKAQAKNEQSKNKSEPKIKVEPKAKIEQKSIESTDSKNKTNNQPKKNTAAEQNPDISLYKYSNASSEFFHSLSFSQYLGASNFIAIDIDTDKVRFITGKAAKKGIQVKEWGVHVTPDNESDRYKSIKITLDNIKTNHYKAGYKVHACFFSPDITIRQFVLPKLKKTKELKNAIYFKLQTDLPGFNENSNWRYKVIEEFEDDGTNFLRVVVLVVPGDLIRNLIRMLDDAGLKPETLIPRPVASFHAFQHMMDESDGDVLVDIAYDITHINLITSSNLEYARNIASGASNLEVAVHDKKSKILGPDSIKVNEEDGIGKNGAVKPDMIRKVLQQRLKLLQSQQNPVLQLFKNELQNSIDYFNRLHKNKQAKRIFLTGYGIQKESLLSFLKNNMKLPVFVLAPKLDNLKNNILQFGQYFTTLGTVIGSKDLFNLIPREYKNQLMFKRLNFLMGILVILIILGLGYLNSIGTKNSDDLQLQLTKMNNQYQELNPVEVEYENKSTQIRNLQNEQARILNLIKRKSPVIEVMKFLSNETPPQIILNNFSLNLIDDSKAKIKGKKTTAASTAKAGYLLQFSGNVVGDYLLSDITLINYVDHLKSLNVFKSLDIIDKEKKNNQQSMRFEIKATL